MLTAHTAASRAKTLVAVSDTAKPITARPDARHALARVRMVLVLPVPAGPIRASMR
jgi:hypothetical protein